MSGYWNWNERYKRVFPGTQDVLPSCRSQDNFLYEWNTILSYLDKEQTEEENVDLV